MQSRHFPVVVVGAGPAGTSAAHTLALSGVQTCIIDKCTFPRDKLCGGLLTLRSRKAFDRIFSANWDKILQATAHEVTFYYKNTELATPKDSYLYFTQRRDYDHYLLQLAILRGASAILGNSAKAVESDANQVL